MRDFPSDFKRKAKALPAFPDVEVLAELALDLVRALICWTALESAWTTKRGGRSNALRLDHKRLPISHVCSHKKPAAQFQNEQTHFTMLLVCRTKQSIGITTKQLTGSQIGSNPSKKKDICAPLALETRPASRASFSASKKMSSASPGCHSKSTAAELEARDRLDSHTLRKKINVALLSWSSPYCHCQTWKTLDISWHVPSSKKPLPRSLQLAFHVGW